MAEDPKNKILHVLEKAYTSPGDLSIGEIAKKDPMKLTKEEVAKIKKAAFTYLYSPKNPENINFESSAGGLLKIKEIAPELYKHAIEMDIALALGKYTPGEGPFKKKYADPYFPSR